MKITYYNNRIYKIEHSRILKSGLRPACFIHGTEMDGRIN